jgi:hypothetical protein
MSAEETVPAEKNNSNVNPPQKPHRSKWFADAFVIILCVSGAAVSLNMFRLDLFQSIASQNKKPMGTVTVKYNNVQRRFSDRVLWSRLAVESPVYLGDLIRVAEYSAATLNINNDIIDINENSLIRIRASSDGEGRIVIDLDSGNLSITGSATDSSGVGVALNVMGRVIAPAAGATLSASAGDSGMTLRVNEGSVSITEKDGQSRSMAAGEALILDTGGVEQAAPAAVVTLPRPNARFIKSGAEPLNIRFTWNVQNLDQTQPLRLEIAAGPHFSHIVRTADSVDFSNVTLGAGAWYWRLSYQNTVLSSGQFTIVDAAMSAPVSPIQDSLFRYGENLPSVRFEWQPVEETSYYILEAGLAPDLTNPSITRQTAVASFVESGMEAGTWYWRVKPVFSPVYEGSAVFSQVASFSIEKLDETVVTAAAETVNDPPVMPALSEPEPIPAATPKPAKPVTPRVSGTRTSAGSTSNPSVTPSVSSLPQTPVLLPEENNIPPAVPASTNGFISSTAGWKTMYHKSSVSNISIGKEIIDGMERDVLTINATLSREDNNWAGTALGQGYLFHNAWSRNNMKYNEVETTDTALIQKLINANGVRFKVLGDGKRWRIYFLTSDVKDNAFHGMTISTQNGEVSSHDISYNRLNQPDSRERAVRFNKNNIKEMVIEKSSNTNNFGTSTIKIFDFEVY